MPERVWRLICASALCATLLVASLPARAQVLEPGEIVVKVMDATSHIALPNAAVVLFGANTPTSTLANEIGAVTFSELDPGSYSVQAQMSGYKDSAIVPVEVGEGQRVAVAIALEPELKTIAVVTAKASVTITTTTIGDDSSERKVSSSLKDALGKLAGITLDDTTYGPNASLGISLNNHDASQTGISIGGINISSQAAAGLSTALDLFSGASVSFAPTAGSVAGNIDYHLFRPTKSWTYSLTNTIGNLGASTQAASFSGTKGKFAVAIQGVVTTADLPLDGFVYADQSGQSYLHQATNFGSAAVVNASYTLNPKFSLHGYWLHSNQSRSSVCANFTTLVPCGLGPDNPSTSRGDSITLSGNVLVGHVSLYGYGNAYSGSSDHDSPGRSLNGVVSPYQSSGTYSSLNLGLSASLSAGRHTAFLGVSTGSNASHSFTTYNGVPFSAETPPQRTSSLFFSDQVNSNLKLKITHTVDAIDSSASGGTLYVDESADWKPAKNDTYNANISMGSSAHYYPTSRYVSDPFSADYDCYNHSIFVSGGNDTTSHQSQLTYALTWRHDFGPNNVTVQLSRQGAAGQLFNAAIPIAGEPPAAFPNGLPAYLASLQAVWNSPNVCGSIPFQTDRIYAGQGIAGLGQLTTGLAVTGRVAIGNVLVLPTFALSRAVLSSLDARMEYPGSFYAAGVQLPKKPLMTAGLTLDGLLAHAKMEWLVNAQYLSGNNVYNQPAFTTYTAGLVVHVHPGSITILDTNVFNTHSGLFTTYQGVNPRPVIGGGTFAYSTSPLPPRQWQITWRIPWSQHISPTKPTLPPAVAAPKPKPSSSPSPKP